MDKVCLDTVKVRAVSYGNGTSCPIPIKLAHMWPLVKCCLQLYTEIPAMLEHEKPQKNLIFLFFY